MSFDPITSIIDLVKTGVDKIFPDAGEKERRELAEFMGVLQARVSVLVAEMSGNWLQKSWRPILMLSFVAIIVNNYILFPYLELFFPGNATVLELPPDMWGLLKIGVGGYIVGRSVEKGVETFKK